MIKFFCSNCGTKIEAEPEYAGAAASCPSCSHDLVVPGQPAPQSNAQAQEPVTRSAATDSQENGARASKGVRGLVIFHHKLKRLLSKKWAIPFLGVLGLILVGSFYAILKKPNDLLDPRDPMYSTYKKAGIWYTVYRKKVGGEFLYMGKSDKPFTGWVKMPRTEYVMVRRLIHFTSGRLDRDISWYQNGKLWEDVTFDSNKQDTVDVSPIQSPHRVTGVISVRQWRIDGEVCTRTKVINGEGESVDYDGTREVGMFTYRDGLKTKKKKPSYNGAGDADLNLSDKEIESSPVYTQGYNKGREEAMRGEAIKANPYNELAEKKNHHIWNRGYSVGEMSVFVERRLLK
jgi:hypothetical protein